MPIDIVEQAVAAHGGLDLWESASEISVQISAGGLAFASKLQGHAVRDVQARIATSGQHVTFAPYPTRGQRGVMRQDGTVRIETDAGVVVQERENARGAFADLRHKLWWDRLDILYFGTYAIWTYLSTPFLFVREDYLVRELEPWIEDGERWRRLAVTFPSTSTRTPVSRSSTSTRAASSAATITPPSRSAAGPRPLTTASIIRPSTGW